MTETTSTLTALAFVIVFGIGAGIYSIARVDWDHEQMSVTRSIAWETSHDR